MVKISSYNAKRIFELTKVIPPTQVTIVWAANANAAPPAKPDKMKINIPEEK